MIDVYSSFQETFQFLNFVAGTEPDEPKHRVFRADFNKGGLAAFVSKLGRSFEDRRLGGLKWGGRALIERSPRVGTRTVGSPRRDQLKQAHGWGGRRGAFVFCFGISETFKLWEALRLEGGELAGFLFLGILWT